MTDRAIIFVTMCGRLFLCFSVVLVLLFKYFESRVAVGGQMGLEESFQVRCVGL